MIPQNIGFVHIFSFQCEDSLVWVSLGFLFDVASIGSLSLVLLFSGLE